MNWKYGAIIGITAGIGGVGLTFAGLVVTVLATIFFSALTSS